MHLTAARPVSVFIYLALVEQLLKGLHARHCGRHRLLIQPYNLHVGAHLQAQGGGGSHQSPARGESVNEKGGPRWWSERIARKELGWRLPGNGGNGTANEDPFLKNRSANWGTPCRGGGTEVKL